MTRIRRTIELAQLVYRRLKYDEGRYSLIQIIMRNFHHFFVLSPASFLWLLLSFAVVPEVVAEFECSSEVSYSWVRTADDSGSETGLPQASVTGAGSPGPASKPGDGSTTGGSGAPSGKLGSQPLQGANDKVKVVKFIGIVRKGATEEAARALLEPEVQRQKNRAAERCKRAHESTGDCLTTKLSIKASTLNSLSFSTRAQAERALIEECQMQQGRCLSVDATTPSCREASSGPAVESSGSASAKTDTKGKDGKAKDAKAKDEKPKAAAPKKK